MNKLRLSIIIFLLFPSTATFSQTQTIFTVPKYPYETCIADYDLDGDNDIIVGCSGPNQDPDSLVFFINDGWGNFEKFKFEAINGLYIYCQDLTNDGYPDIIARDGDSIFFYENNQSIGIGTGYFIKDTYGNPFIGGIADFNLDSSKDLLFYDITVPWSWGVAFNNGDNTFTDSLFVASNGTNLFLSTGYINDDNRPDLLVTTLNQSENVKVLYNYYPDFIEQVIATPDWNRGYILNVNNDTLNDVLLARPLYFGTTWIVNMLNKFDHFQACDTLVFVNGSGIKNICDYNLDGYDDLSMTVYQANNQPIEDSVYIYFNDHKCGYTHAQSVFMGDYVWLPTINSDDLNGDGFPELVVQGYLMPLWESFRILWNDGTGHFIDTNSVYVHQKEIRLKQQIDIFPNPTVGKLLIRSTGEKIKNIKVMDLNGRILYRETYSPCQANVNLDISKQQVKPGMYLCIIQLENDISVFKKLIVKK